MSRVFICPPPSAPRLTGRTIMAVGFGQVDVRRDEECVWSGDDETVTMRRFMGRARKDPDHDWRVTFYGPLVEEEYQRQPDGRWTLLRRGDGFA